MSADRPYTLKDSLITCAALLLAAAGLTMVVTSEASEASVRAGAPAPMRTTPPYSSPIAQAKGRNNAGKPDRVIVRVYAAASGAATGARVRLFSFQPGDKSGTKRQVARDTLDGDGKVVFVVVDTNGRGSTVYYARISSTDSTTAARSNNLRLR